MFSNRNSMGVKKHDPVEATKVYGRFGLRAEFLQKWKDVRPLFGFNGLGEVVYNRTYSRIKSYDKMGYPIKEKWFDTIQRCVEGVFTIQKWHMLSNGLEWREEEKQDVAERMFEKFFTFKLLPPGRGLWTLGTKVIEERGLYAALNNCGFVDTSVDFNMLNGMETSDEKIEEVTKPFAWAMDSLMLGIGVGFNTGKEKQIFCVSPDSKIEREYVIEDSREGWVSSVWELIKTYVEIKPDVTYSRKSKLVFDYSKLRPYGQPIKGFGGVSSGPDPLKELHCEIVEQLEQYNGKFLDPIVVTNIMNLIASCVVAGNIRRSAMIAFGPTEGEFIHLKNYDKYPERAKYGWTSNNSIFAKVGMDYNIVAECTAINGEPGYVYLDNIHKYGRFADPPDYKDSDVRGLNPCAEQPLENYELCTLVETFPTHHETLDDFKDTIELAIEYGKTVTLGKCHWNETSDVMAKNRRIGCSVSGITQFVAKHGIDELRRWCNEGYLKAKEMDIRLSKDFNVNRSIRLTTVKPSGTVSLLAGVTPGVHYAESNYYIRRVRIPKSDSSLFTALKEAGYKYEDCVYGGSNYVFEFPITVGDDVRTLENVSMWEQLNVTAFMQRYWSDNAVSSTVTFRKSEKNDIKVALDYFQYQLKGVSFLPKLEIGDQTVYKQQPYEAISREVYEYMITSISDIDIQYNRSVDKYIESPSDLYCTSDTCVKSNA